jgi:hypothetical protein
MGRRPYKPAPTSEPSFHHLLAPPFSRQVANDPLRNAPHNPEGPLWAYSALCVNGRFWPFSPPSLRDPELSSPTEQSSQWRHRR